MISRIWGWRVFCVATVCLILTSGSQGETRLPSSNEPIPEDQSILILKKLRDANKETLDAIHTWQGRMKVSTDQVFEPDRAKKLFQLEDEPVAPISKQTESSVSFAVDFTGNKVFSDYQGTTPTYSVFAQNQRYSLGNIASYPFMQRSIITPAQYLHVQPNAMYGTPKQASPDMPRSQVAFRSAPEDATRQRLGSVVDPRLLFEIGGSSPVEYLDNVIDYIESENTFEVGNRKIRLAKCIREGKDIGYIFIMPFGQGPDRCQITKAIFSQEFGYSITELRIENSEGKPISQCNWKYHTRDNLLIPTDFVIKLIKDGEKIKFSRRFQIEESSVNKPIPEEVFTYKNLGLKNGSYLMDKIDGSCHIYRDGKLLPVEAGLNAMVDVLLADSQVIKPGTKETSLPEDRPNRDGAEMVLDEQDIGTGSATTPTPCMGATYIIITLTVIAVVAAVVVFWGIHRRVQSSCSTR